MRCQYLWISIKWWKIVHSYVPLIQHTVIFLQFLIHLGQPKIKPSLQRRTNLLPVHHQTPLLQNILHLRQRCGLKNLIFTLFKHGIHHSEEYLDSLVQIHDENTINEAEWQVTEEEILNNVDKERLFFNIVPIEMGTELSKGFGDRANFGKTTVSKFIELWLSEGEVPSQRLLIFTMDADWVLDQEV